MDYSGMIRTAEQMARQEGRRIVLVRIPSIKVEAVNRGSDQFLDAQYLSWIEQGAGMDCTMGVVYAYPNGSSRSSFFHR